MKKWVKIAIIDGILNRLYPHLDVIVVTNDYITVIHLRVELSEGVIRLAHTEVDETHEEEEDDKEILAHFRHHPKIGY